MTTLVNNRINGNADNRSPKAVAWERFSQGKYGVFVQYVSSGNADYSTLSYALAISFIAPPGGVLGCIAISNNQKMYYCFNVGNTESGWTAWKALTGT